jgi:hypothetical protein
VQSSIGKSRCALPRAGDAELQPVADRHAIPVVQTPVAARAAHQHDGVDFEGRGTGRIRGPAIPGRSHRGRMDRDGRRRGCGRRVGQTKGDGHGRERDEGGRGHEPAPGDATLFGGRGGERILQGGGWRALGPRRQRAADARGERAGTSGRRSRSDITKRRALPLRCRSCSRVSSWRLAA